MNFNTPDTLEKNPVGTEKKLSTGQENIKELAENFAKSFLGDEVKYLEKNKISKIISETEKEFLEKENKKILNKEVFVISYNSYQKEFWIKKVNENKEKISIGDIVNAQRLGADFIFDKELEKFTKVSDVKNVEKLKKIVLENELQNILHTKLNKELAESLSENTEIRRENARISELYKEIAENYDTKNKQLGFWAEQIMIGVLQGLAIDRSDLGFNVLEANVVNDVSKKVDFIIERKETRRGVGVGLAEEEIQEVEGKSIGIQFTIKKDAQEDKEKQIATVLKRGKVGLNDIIYVELNQEILQKAVKKWEEDGKPITGPWKFLPVEIRQQVIENLLKGILSEEQIKSLTKNIK
jgi:hypothetical protein